MYKIKQHNAHIIPYYAHIGLSALCSSNQHSPMSSSCRKEWQGPETVKINLEPFTKLRHWEPHLLEAKLSRSSVLAAWDIEGQLAALEHMQGMHCHTQKVIT